MYVFFLQKGYAEPTCLKITGENTGGYTLIQTYVFGDNVHAHICVP